MVIVTPRIALVRAPNPSAMTLSGTNSYIVDCGNGEALCIDPGPDVPRHVDALLDAAREMGVRIKLIALTHTHPDHAPAAAPLKAATGAPVAASVKTEYPHDRSMSDGETICLGNCEVEVADAPGHTFDHLVFFDRRDRALFTGDTVLGEGYVVIAPPNGDMRAYVRTLRSLLERFGDAGVLCGGHGEPVRAPAEKLKEYLQHRRTREAELIEALARGEQTIPELVTSIYAQTNRALWPAAARQMLAYLLALEQEGRVRSHELPRALTGDEHAILNPEWETIVGPEHAKTVEEELGAMLRLDTVRAYALTDKTILPN